tara:strand:- start:253 stop:366 length:114 start_codon:yes stop_codon:yes gene_type:complete
MMTHDDDDDDDVRVSFRKNALLGCFKIGGVPSRVHYH